MSFGLYHSKHPSSKQHLNHAFWIVKLKYLLRCKFDTKNVGATKKILGIEIHHDRGTCNCGYLIRNILKKVLEMFRILDSKTVKVLLVASFKLSLQLHPILILDKESKCISKMSYANVIGCLMYLTVCTRLNISNAAFNIYIYIYIFLMQPLWPVSIWQIQKKKKKSIGLK